MNKKVLMGLLVSFIACEAMASIRTSTPFSPVVDRLKLNTEMQDSPMTRLVKQRKAQRSSVPVAKAALQRTKALETSEKQLKQEVSSLTEKNMEQQIQIGYSKFIAQARQAARDKLVELLSEDTETSGKLEDLAGDLAEDLAKEKDTTAIRAFLAGEFTKVSDNDLLLPFKVAALEANERYQAKLAELQAYIASSKGLISPAIQGEFLSLSDSIVKSTTPTKDLEDIKQEVMDALQGKFGEYDSVMDIFLEVMHRELDGLDEAAALSSEEEDVPEGESEEEDDSESKTKGSASSPLVKSQTAGMF